MAKKLVIFDLDNTLTVTRPAAKQAYKHGINHIAKAAGRYRDKFKLYNHWKKIVQKVMRDKKPHKRRFEYSLKLLLDEQRIPTTHLASALNAYEKELLDNLSPQRGAKEILDWIDDEGHIIAVATGSNRSEATKKLKRVELYKYISVLVTPNETDTMKPDPSFYSLILDQTRVKPGRALVVGDSQQEDLDPAEKLGLSTLLVPPVSPHLGKLRDEIHKFLSK